eukprot:CAMPEP_0170524086 /NCGR_PEP_ID=MMETSP0209-20121228/9500_1 /TAXON_ID=665100 ORGANISM="Litonotus pictus, Strain P1" /NCGR_SAMPLE_ID=MMETSP0209 /ASSEMBLY_ACC=CAM_ASM_000301 /LENGTH=193 /DNA_ID=CAMNT_0010812561 /DNA_START=653 /DNA_END=1231 /DNA_ORIENTATION=-
MQRVGETNEFVVPLKKNDKKEEEKNDETVGPDPQIMNKEGPVEEEFSPSSTKATSFSPSTRRRSSFEISKEEIIEESSTQENQNSKLDVANTEELNASQKIYQFMDQVNENISKLDNRDLNEKEKETIEDSEEPISSASKLEKESDDDLDQKEVASKLTNVQIIKALFTNYVFLLLCFCLTVQQFITAVIVNW